MNPIGACEFTQRKIGLGTGEEAIGSNRNGVKVTVPNPQSPIPHPQSPKSA